MNLLPEKIKSQKDLMQFVNNHKYKMEIGAANNPICDGINTLFVDYQEESLLQTASEINIHKTTEFMVADAADIPIPDSSIDCIVSAFFDWKCQNKHRTVYFLEILGEWRRIIKNNGHIVIMSSKNCIGDMLQICDMVGLKVLKIFDTKNYFTLILQRI